MLLFWALLQVAGPVTLFRVAWCVTLLFTGCSFWCCAGYGWCCQPVSPMSRLVSGSILTLDFNAFELHVSDTSVVAEMALMLSKMCAAPTKVATFDLYNDCYYHLFFCRAYFWQDVLCTGSNLSFPRWLDECPHSTL